MRPFLIEFLCSPLATFNFTMWKYLIMPHIHYSASYLNTFCCSRHSEILPFLPSFCLLYISTCPLYQASIESPHAGCCSRCFILGWPKSLYSFFPNHLMEKSIRWFGKNELFANLIYCLMLKTVLLTSMSVHLFR